VKGIAEIVAVFVGCFAILVMFFMAVIIMLIEWRRAARDESKKINDGVERANDQFKKILKSLGVSDEEENKN
jgi:predicted RND superfamily exporter protein